MKVLIVEDDAEKLRRLVTVLVRAGVGEECISEARSTQQAKVKLRTDQFDLLLLDLNIPQRLQEEPKAGEGLALLEEISARPKYLKPAHVIGVTAFDSELKTAQPVFDAALVPIFRYERESSEWELPLQRRVEYLEATVRPNSAPSVSEYDYDVVIITALQKPELSAILDIPWSWKAENHHDDDTTYYVGKTTKGLRIVAAHSPFMGMPAASILSTKAITRYRPRYLIHSGIAAGVKGQAEIGDVLVADPSWDWGSGKFAIEDGELVFYAAPYQILLREDVRGPIRRLADDEQRMSAIRAAWKGEKPSTVLSVRLGPVASGASVLADGKVKESIRDQHRKLIGIEMETYGVMAAAEFASKPRPLAVSLKSVCDFADGEKNDRYQPYAAYTSAAIVAALIEDYLE